MKKIKGSIYVILFLILLLVWLFSEAKAETYIQIGPNFVSGEYSQSGTLIIEERWRGKYSLSMGYISSQVVEGCGGRPRSINCIFPVQEQLIFGAERIVKGNFGNFLDRFSFRFGPYYFQNANRISSCRFVGRLALDFELNKNWSLMASHFSNGGSCPSIQIENPPGVIHRGKFNMGQDAILITRRF